MTQILIVDDHPVIRRGLKQILAEDPDLTVIGEAGTARQGLQILRERGCDVMLLDLNLPDRHGLDVLQEVRLLRPGLPVLVLSMHPEELVGVRVLKAGAAGYLNKDSAPEELIRAVHKVRRGGRYVGPKLAERMADALQPGADRPAHESLTDREYQVLRLLGQGKTVSGIADELTLSVKTVSTYRTRMLEKLDLKSTAQLIAYAHRENLAG